MDITGAHIWKGRNPPGEAIRGQSRPSTALDPERAAQGDPVKLFAARRDHRPLKPTQERTRSRGMTRLAVGAFSAMVVGG